MSALEYRNPETARAENRFRPLLHGVAIATAVATFPLIFMGGLVTSHGAGMSVPDWPNSYGYNMFTFPPSQWVGGIFYEHTHRLMGTVVGMLSIALTIIAWCVEPRRWVRWLATGVLGAVIVQGVLGGLRVVMVELDLAIVHACFAQAFFCLAALTCVVTSKWWHDTRDTGFQPVRSATPLVTLGIVSVFAIFLQLLVGAMMRHYNAGLAIPDVPLNYGHVLPPMTDEALKTANDYRKWDLHLSEVTMVQVWLHFGHRVGAILVSGLLIALVVRVSRSPAREVAIRNPAIAIAGLLIVQVTLGVITVLMKKPADIASAHVACGALLLVATFVLTVRAMRLACDTGFQPVRNAREQQVLDLPTRTHGLEARVTMSAT